MRPESITVQCAGITAISRPADPSQNSGRSISGTIATYGQTVNPMGPWFSVRLMPGALEVPESLSDVKLLDAHDRTQIIGSLTDISEDGESIQGSFRMARTTRANDAFSLVSDGHLDGLSVGYRVLDGRDVIEDEQEIFEVTRAELYEVSLVGWPADRTARIGDIAARAQEGNTMNAPVNDPAPADPPLSRADLDSAVSTAVSAALAAATPPPTLDPVPAPQGAVQAAAGQRVVRTEDGRVIAVQASDRARSPYPGVYTHDGRYITAGDYFVAWYKAMSPEGDSGEFQSIRAALADELTSDVPGLLPKQIVGELLGRASGRRPVWDSLSPKDMPMVGQLFSRPRIIQSVKVDPQATQKTQVASQKMTVSLDDIQKVTLAGGLDIAYQVIDWTSPSFMNEVIQNFVAVYLRRTDQLAATNLSTIATGGPVAWDGTPGTLNKALATAAVTVYNSVPALDVMPNTVWISPDVWAILAGLSDTTNRPLFPFIGPTNATGQVDLSNPSAGLTNGPFKWVVGKNFPALTMIMGDSAYTESYENGRRFLQAERPDVLGRDIAYSGYVATYFPYPASLVKFTVTPPAGFEAVAPAATK